MSTRSNTPAPVNTVNTTTTTAKGNKRNTAKGNITALEQSTPAPKPAPVNWARLTEQERTAIVVTVRGLYSSISALKKAETKSLILEQGVTVTRGDNSKVYHFNDRGYLSMLKAVKDTRKFELKQDTKALKRGYGFNEELYARFNWAMSQPQYSTYCEEIARELGEVSPETVGDWVSKFYPYQDTEHGILVPVWVCPTATAKTPGIMGRCARVLVYPEQYTVGTAATVFARCIDNWARLAAKAIGVSKEYTAPTLYTPGTVQQVCKFDPVTGAKGDTITAPGTDFVTAYGAGELTTVARWRYALKLKAEQGK